jgi:hypothetical protein
MSDREWLDSLPADVDFVGLRTGQKCRPVNAGPGAPPPPSPDHVFIDGGWVSLADLRTWPPVRKPK